jgi:hypothetical protein
MEVLAPRELLDRPDQRFELLVGGHTRSRRRQQTLQATMEWSWALLNPDQQKLLAVLSVFVGDWPLASAEEIGQPFLTGPVIGSLRQLLAASLVEPVYHGQSNRFRLLNTVRLFARARLKDMGIAGPARGIRTWERHLPGVRPVWSCPQGSDSSGRAPCERSQPMRLSRWVPCPLAASSGVPLA